jgi:hypothetical protein
MNPDTFGFLIHFRILPLLKCWSHCQEKSRVVYTIPAKTIIIATKDRGIMITMRMRKKIYEGKMVIR